MLPYTTVYKKPNSSHPKQINSFPHKDDTGCGEEMTNNSRKHYGVSLCSCQCHHATAWLFKRHGDKHVSSTELRKRDNGGNVSYSCWITERKHCNELKAQQWLIQIQPLTFYLFIYLEKKKVKQNLYCSLFFPEIRWSYRTIWLHKCT